MDGRLPRRSRLRWRTAADQQLQEAVLRVVGVLVLVDEHVAEARRVALADLGEELQQVDGAKQQVVEVHRVHAHQVALVQLVHLGDQLLEVRADLPGCRRRRRCSWFLAAEIWLWIAAGV